MNIEQLEAIQAIVQKGSFRAAAESLNKSQPALSASIKNLEDELGVAIFDRSNYRPQVTEEGRVLIEASKQVLQAAHHFARVGKELGQMKIETKLRVSIDPLTPLEAVEMIAQECARPACPVTLIFSKAILKGCIDDLLSDRSDLAIGQCTGETSELEIIHVKTMTLVGVASRDLLGHLHEPTEDFLEKNAQILVYDKDVDEPPVEIQGQRIFAPDHFSKLRMIESSLGWGRISEEELASRPNLLRVGTRFSKPLVLDICLMRPRHRPLGPIARKIWSVFEGRFPV